MSCHFGLNHLYEKHIRIDLRKVAVNVLLFDLFYRKYLHMLTVSIVCIGILSLMIDQVRIEECDPVIVHIVSESEIHKNRFRNYSIIIRGN